MWKIFLCEEIHPDAKRFLEEHAEVFSDPTRMSEADGIVNRNLHIDRAWIAGCPRLKVIGIHGTGRDGVDMAAAREFGVQVIYVPGENALSVAELVVTFALALSRRIVLGDRLLQSGKLPGNAPAVLQGHELTGRTFGMVGCGNVAVRAAGILHGGFGMELLGFDPMLTDRQAGSSGIRRVPDLKELFAASDVVSISVPLTPQTKKLISAEVLACAKPGLILINTARGGIVDEGALYEALKNGPLGAAACDVFVSEPPTRENPLTALPNFIATPHIGANTQEALCRVGMGTVTQMIAVLEGRTRGLHIAPELL